MKATESAWVNAIREAHHHDALLFGHMFEDWTIEADVFPSGSRVFCIASAGCTALNLAALGHHVTAVDINPAQVALVRERVAGEPTREGRVDRMMTRGRAAMRLVGWTQSKLRDFLELDDPAEQRVFWRGKLETRRWRLALATLLSPLVLRLFYPSELVRAFPRDFSTIIAGRLEHGFSTHPNRTNPYARGLLLGEWPSSQPSTRPGSLEVLHAGAAEYLENCPPRRSFTAFTLSNILDGAGTSYARRLEAAIARTAAPGAVRVLRSFYQPETVEEETWARRDRALLWGRVRVER